MIRPSRSSLPALLALTLLLAGTADAATTTLVATGSTWSYLDDGSDQGTAWRAVGFDAGSWASGPAQLGYGDGDESTTVGFGPDSGNKYVTTYFRQVFPVSGASGYTYAQLRIVRDDGAVVYLNGTEVARSNMPGGAIASTTAAASVVSGADESAFQSFAIDPSLLVDGNNTLAVEIHQANGTSSDISFDLELVASDTAIVTRGPYLQVATPDSVVVRWRTDQATDSVVRYGAAPGSLGSSATDAAVTTEHEVEITSLTPATLYYYSVGSGGEVLAGDDASYFFTTSPSTGTSTPTRIWVIGDSGTANANAAAVRNAFETYTGSRGQDLWLMLGDNAYSDGTDTEFQAAVFDMYPEILRTTPLWPTLGNHDGHTADSATESGPYYAIFTLPRQAEAGGVASGTEAYYSFDYGNIHFICLESYETDRSPGGAMLTWLEDDLLATDADWVIAFWHHPPYTKGSHDSDTETQLVQMRTNALPLLEAYGVDLVLSGHSHSYERSFLVDQHYGTSDTLQPWMILDSGDGSPAGDGAYAKPTLGPAPHEGAVYAVAGSSGQTSSAPLNHPVMYVSLLQLGSMVIDVDGPVLEARFLNSAGQVTDRFEIDKGAAGPVCGDGVAEGDEECDGLDLAGATCGGAGCSAGTPSCTGSCTLDYSTCSGCPVCDNDLVCEPGEDCDNCPGDCAGGFTAGAICGNGVCEAGDGEDCLSCPSDCNGVQNGRPSGRFCCGDGDGSNSVRCSDPRCTQGGIECTTVPTLPTEFCCGDALCSSGESCSLCPLDCAGGAEVCDNGLDDDCDGAFDCSDTDCSDSPACACAASNETCAFDADCCSGHCRTNGKKAGTCS